MFKKITSILLIILFVNVILLSGYYKELKYFDNSIQYELDWVNLFLEGHEIDLKAAELACKKLKGGYYDKNLHAVVPADVSQTEKEWKKAKDHIAHIIGPLPYLPTHNNLLWENSAQNVDTLLQDALIVAPSFKRDFQYMAFITGTTAYFGPHNQNIVKTRESLASKVNRDASTLDISEKEAVTKIGDTLRGTMIVDDIFQIHAVIAEIINYAHHKNAQVAFKNLWVEDRKSGYVGIHAKILLPLPKSKFMTKPRYILAEMQIHLHSIVDGTNESVKEREHLIYEHARLENFDYPVLSAASKLLFLTAMQDILKSLDEE